MINKNFNEEFRQSLKIIGGTNYKILLLFCLFLSVSFLEFFGLGLMVPLISLFLESNIDNEFILNFEFLKNRTKEQILNIFLLVFLIKYILLLSQNYLLPRFAFNNQKKLRKNLIKNFIFKNSNLQSSELIQTTSATLTMFTANYLLNIFRLFSSFVMVTVIFCFLLIFNLNGTVFISIIIILLFLFYRFFFKKKFKILGDQLIESNSKIIELTNEIFKGIDEIKVYGKYKLFLNKLNNFSSKYSDAEVSIRFLVPLPRVLIEIIVLSSFFFILFVALMFGYKTQLVSLVIFGYASLRIIPSLNEFITALNVARSAKKAVNILYKHGLENSLEEKNDFKFKKEKFNKLVVSKLSFKYSENKSYSIKDLTFELKRGDFLGIIGPSGVGKSTLMKILVGFIKPNSGKLILNERPQKNYQKYIQNFSSYIPQDNYILKSTLRENISLEDNNFKNNDSKIWNSLKLAGLKQKFILNKSGLDYRFKESGKNLSGGQKQRISIARSLYHEKEILFFDEGTSSLDPKSEDEILYYLSNKKDLTKVVISHRKNTLKYCNKVIDFTSGKACLKKYVKK